MSDMKPTQFFMVPNERLEHGLRCVIYEMLVLALALVELQEEHEKFPGLPFGDEKCADVTALLKSRVLIEFLFKTNGIPTEYEAYYNSVQKWTAHLTWQRVDKDVVNFPQPFNDDIQKYGKAVLGEALTFVETCQQNFGYSLTSRNAEGYLAKFKEQYGLLK